MGCQYFRLAYRVLYRHNIPNPSCCPDPFSPYPWIPWIRREWPHMHYLHVYPRSTYPTYRASKSDKVVGEPWESKTAYLIVYMRRGSTWWRSLDLERMPGQACHPPPCPCGADAPPDCLWREVQEAPTGLCMPARAFYGKVGRQPYRTHCPLI